MNPTSIHRRGHSPWPSGVLLLLIACNGRRCGGPDDTGQDCADADKRVYYADSDGDGFGDALDVTETCVAPKDTVTNGDDCDDTDPARVDMVALWADADGDGYGTGDPVAVCEGEPSYAAQDGDCDDSDGAVHPGASTVAENGKDDDCDGLSDIDAPAGERDANEADVRITGSAAGALGYAVHGAGDLTDDGWPDLAVGAPQEDGVGAAYIYFGPIAEGAMSAEDAALRFTGPSEGAAAGAAFVSGKFTEDEVPDLGVLCGDGRSRDGGASAYLLHGPVAQDGVLASGDEVTFVKSSGTTALDAADFIGEDGALDLVGSFSSDEMIKLARGPFAESYDEDDDFYGILIDDSGSSSKTFGASLTFVGDLTGDGVPELAVGAPTTSDNGADGEYRSDAGAVYIIDTPQIIRQDEFGDITLRILGDVSDGLFGEAVAPAGDVDGDGAADLWVSAPSLDGDSGAVYLFSGGAVVSSADPFTVGPTDALLTLAGASDAGRFGAKLAGSADANGDGVMDLAVAAPEANGGQGAVYLWYGPVGSGDTSDADLTLIGEGSGDRFGASISLRDDMNLLGNVDLVVGAPGANDGDGAAYVFFMDGL